MDNSICPECDGFFYRADDWAAMLADERRDIGYGAYSPQLLYREIIGFFEDDEPMCECSVIAALQDGGIYPVCELCGWDSELAPDYINIHDHPGGFVCVCWECERRIVRRASKLSGVKAGKGCPTRTAIPTDDWWQFFDYALLERLCKRATEKGDERGYP